MIRAGSYRTLFCVLLPLVAVPARAADAPVFEKTVLPILRAKCVRCHGGEKVKGDLDVRSKAALVKGGESGAAVVAGSSEKSLLWVKVAADKMPPDKDKLSESEKTLIRAWIDAGAKDDGSTIATDVSDKQVTDADRQFWAFRPPTRPAVPKVKSDRGRNPIDAFVLAALEKRGLTLAPEADRLTLIRRVTFDLTGLPPTPQEIAAFLADAAPDAYERLIDRLLASPHYGERWGRHWLDLAGYADSEGILDADYVRSAAWRYRDYVLRAFNTDKPYDRFLQEQLAGDELTDYWTAYQTRKELPAEVVDGLIATGYLRCASDTSRPDFVSIKNAPGYYYQTLEDTQKIVASSLMGLTVQCAKCHSHKYDPIPQTDYYRLQAVFMSAYRPSQWVPQVQRKLNEATAAQEKEAADANKKVDAVVAKIKKEDEALRQSFAERLFADGLAKLPEAIREDVRVALATAPDKQNEVQKYLVAKFRKDLRPDAGTLPAVLARTYPEYAERSKTLADAIRSEEAKRVTFPEIRALFDLPGEPKTPLLRRGDYLNPGPEVRPGVLSVLATTKPFSWSPPSTDTRTSKRRLAFAEWLTQPDHPLTARVLVNRLWLHHFGEGIVGTPDNFGRAGDAPTHPELLDWLATEFVARGWSVKAMHRLMLTSSVYRQSSAVSAETRAAAKKIDPDNHLLWRQRLRRLEAESLRDSVLSVSGMLNPQMSGTPVPIQRQGDGEVVAAAGPAGQRRSVYLQVRRSQPVTILQVFDQPVLETNCTRRMTSTVSSQALTLLNSDFMARQATAFAERILKERPDDPAGWAVQLAFGRPATTKEHETLTGFLIEQAKQYDPKDEQAAKRRALADLCHMLVSTNEFAYIE
jgi:hypothetical protein